MSKSSEIRESIRRILIGILKKDEEAADWIIEGSEAEGLRGRFAGKEKPLGVVSFDVDRIKEFVFTSTKPLEVHGASEIVNDLTLRDYRKGESGLPACSVHQILADHSLGDDNVIFAGGGTGLLLVPAEQTEQIAKEIRSRFAKHSQTGSCSIVWRRFYPHELVIGPDSESKQADVLPRGVSLVGGKETSSTGFGSIVRLLADELRQVKEENPATPMPPLPGYVRPCEACGIRAAIEPDPEQRDWLCSSCAAHRGRGRRERKRLRDHEPDLTTAETINDIAGTDEERAGHVAFIHADADGMGQKLSKMTRMEDLALFSRTVSAVIKRAREDLVRKHKLAGRYQAPIVGGDDIFLIVPAAKAVPIASDLMEQLADEFRREAKEFDGENQRVAEELEDVSISLGFVVVPAHFDIRFSARYAEALLRQAKRGRYLKGEACLDYSVITDGSPLTLELQELRKSIYLRESPTWKLRLTGRPITVSRFRQIRQWMEELEAANVPRSQLKIIEDLLHRASPRVARLNIRYQWIRVDAWKRLFKEGQVNKEDQDKMKVWLDELVLHEIGPRSYESSFVDLIELYDLRRSGHDEMEA